MTSEMFWARESWSRVGMELGRASLLRRRETRARCCFLCLAGQHFLFLQPRPQPRLTQAFHFWLAVVGSGAAFAQPDVPNKEKEVAEDERATYPARLQDLGFLAWVWKLRLDMALFLVLGIQKQLKRGLCPSSWPWTCGEGRSTEGDTSVCCALLGLGMRPVWS